jgi:conjugal transfer pilus assembly protein TraI
MQHRSLHSCNAVFLRSLFERTRPPAPPAGAPAGYRADQAPSFPSADPGIQVVGVDGILAAHQDLISRIKLCYGAERETFEGSLLVTIRNYASFVSLLPATSDNFFSEVGGLLRLGLEVAFFALQGTDGHIVSGRATISARRQLEPRWRHATFLAGLCCELHRTLAHVVVTDERGDEWPAYLGPLTPWLAERRAKRFFVRWITPSHESRALCLFALPHIVPASTMQHLAAGNSIAVPHMISCLSGVPLSREQNVLADLVKRAAALVIDRDLVVSAHRYGRPIVGAHLERYLLDAMRRLIASHPAWTPNQERSRVWLGTEGLFVVWPNAATEIRKLLEEDELPGIPKAPETILEILLSAGVFQSRATGQALWTISPPSGKGVVEAVKVTAPELLLPPYFEVPASLPTLLTVQQPSRPSVPPPTFIAQEPSAPPASNAQGRLFAGDDAPQSRAATGAEDADAPVESGPEATSFDGTEAGTSAEARASVRETPAGALRLMAPMRLHPQVRDCLSVAIDSLNRDPAVALAVAVSSGAFVPLAHFRRAGLAVPVVLRALGDAAMTVASGTGASGTVEHEVRGRPETGVVIKPQFVEGWGGVAQPRGG